MKGLPLLGDTAVSRAGVVAVAAGAVAVALRWWGPALVWLPLTFALAGAAIWITHRSTGSGAVTTVVAGSYLIRAALALALFVISSFGLPVLRSLHVDHGLWAFGVDGVAFHEHAVKLLEAWRAGADLQSAFVVGGVSFEIYQNLSILVAAVYAVLGVSPLHFVLVNAWLGSMSALLGYVLALRLGASHRGATIGSALIGFWPSSMIWATQLLKDPLVLTVDLAALLAVVVLWQRYSVRKGTESVPWAGGVAGWAALACAAFGLAYIRNHVGILLAASVCLVMGAVALSGVTTRRPRQAMAAAAIGIVVAAFTVAGMSVDLLSFMSAARSEVVAAEPPVVIAESASVQATGAAPSGAAPASLTLPAPSAGGFVRPGWRVRLRELVQTPITTIVWLRRAEVEVGGASLIDSATFDDAGDVIAYVPRALANAFLAPFPWQWGTGTQTGVFRALAPIEVVAIGVLLPAMVAGGWRRASLSKPDGLVVVVFIAAVAVGYGMVMMNGGTLFRSRLQFLFPSLVLAATVFSPSTRQGAGPAQVQQT
jgi:hypothetical protein